MTPEQRIVELRAVLASIAGGVPAAELDDHEASVELDRCQRSAERALQDDDRNLTQETNDSQPKETNE